MSFLTFSSSSCECLGLLVLTSKCLNSEATARVALVESVQCCSVDVLALGSTDHDIDVDEDILFILYDRKIN